MAASLGVSVPGAHHFFPGPPHAPSHIPPYAHAAGQHPSYLGTFKGSGRSHRSAAAVAAASPGSYRSPRGGGAYGVRTPLFMHPPTVKWPDMGGHMTAAAAAAYHGVDPGKMLLRPGSDFSGGGMDFGGFGKREEGTEDGDQEGRAAATGAGGGPGASLKDETQSPRQLGYSDTVKRYTVDAHNKVRPHGPPTPAHSLARHQDGPDSTLVVRDRDRRLLVRNAAVAQPYDAWPHSASLQTRFRCAGHCRAF